MKTVHDLLRAKSHDIFTIEEKSSVADACHQMIEHEVGSLIVTSGGKPAGMFTERDVLKVWNETHGDRRFRDIPLGEVMTRETIVASPDDSFSYIMSIMIKNRIRHLPIVEEHKVVGVLSMRDVVRAEVTDLKVENHYLKEYIGGKFF